MIGHDGIEQDRVGRPAVMGKADVDGDPMVVDADLAPEARRGGLRSQARPAGDGGLAAGSDQEEKESHDDVDPDVRFSVGHGRRHE